MTSSSDGTIANPDPVHEGRLAMLGLVATRAAHDLNNQLMVALAKLEMALDVPRISEHALEQAVASILRAADLTERMLVFARKDGGEGVAFDFAAALKSDESFLKLVVPPRVEFRLDVPEAPLCVSGHPARLQQMLLNLVLNAVDAIGERNGRIQVSLRAEDLAGICLEVQDDGCGMDEASVKRLYEPFWTTKPFGRGLGMPMILETVRSHGGEIEVQSQLDLGTRFRIKLPRIAESLVAPGFKRMRKPLSRTNAGGKILVVEDDPFVRQVVASLLGRAGHTPFTAATTATACGLLDSVGGFWLALVDVSLEGGDGTGLIDLIRERSPGTMVALMSGYAREQVLDGLGAEPDGFLRKPFQSADLEAEMNRLSILFKKRGGEPPSPAVPPPGPVAGSSGPSAMP